MANTQRYKPAGNWRTQSHWDAADVNVTVITEVCDLVERHTGRRYDDGCYRVTFQAEPPKPRTKSFYGESAWSAAECYARDEINKLRMARR